MNKLFYGDNLEVLRKYIKDETIDLCYIDPPFNSKRNYNQIYNNIGKEDKAQAQAFTDTWTWDIYADSGFDEIVRNYNGVFTSQSIELIKGFLNVLGKGSLAAYLVSMTLRIAEIHRVLTKKGSFYFHCDPTASHYLKVIIDAIFCPNGGNFINEIVWCYSIGGRSNNNFGEKHDVIFWYSKSDQWLFNQNEPALRISRKQNHMKLLTDENGNIWQIKKDKKTGVEYRYPFDKIANDYWIDIEQLNRDDAERLGYPTQKPEYLLERIIASSTKQGDVILDAFCGCGTSIAVAERLNRQWIGVDITYQSISLILKRLNDSFGANLNRIQISGVPHDIESAIALANKQDDRTRKEFEKWVVLSYSNNRAIINEKKGGDGGIDGISYIADRGDLGETISNKMIFSVKSNKTLTPSVIRDLFGTMQRENAVCGILITLYPMPNLVKESKNYGIYKNHFIGDIPKIEVVNIEEMLNGKTLNIPVAIDVVKSAEAKSMDTSQHKLL